jgi:hypothetical protein
MTLPEFETKEEERMAKSILLVLYETHPLPLTREEIMSRIAAKGLLEMSDEEFKTYRENIHKAKIN